MRGDVEVAVVADDLSGAAECAAAFGATVVLEPSASGSSLVVCTQTRDGSRAATMHRVRQAAQQLREHEPRAWFMKIDSTLRGHIGEALAAMEAIVQPDLTVVAPAFPAQGRVVRGGRVFVDGKALGRDVPVALRNAETDEDLDRIVEAGLSDGGRVLWVGSGGLARRLAAALEIRLARPEVARAGPIAVVVGSAALEAHEQLARLEAATGVRVGQSFDGDSDVAFAAPPPAGALSSAPAHALADLVAPLWPSLGGAVLSGGETAGAVLRAVGASGLRGVGEVEPGVPLCVAEPDGCPVVTKAGAFGDPDVLIRAREALRA